MYHFVFDKSEKGVGLRLDGQIRSNCSNVSRSNRKRNFSKTYLLVLMSDEIEGRKRQTSSIVFFLFNFDEQNQRRFSFLSAIIRFENDNFENHCEKMIFSIKNNVRFVFIKRCRRNKSRIEFVRLFSKF